MVSDFRKKKLLHVFNQFFDVNKSGSVDKKDFELAVEKASQLRGWKSGDAKFKEAQASLMKVWDGISGADADEDGQVSADEWITLWEKSSNADWQSEYAKFVFNLQDASNDGSIDSEEFSSVLASFGLNKDEAVAAFKKLSKGNSNVSWDEFQGLWSEYFSSDDVNAPGNFIFGKLQF